MNVTILLLSFNGAAVIGEALKSLLPLPEHTQLLVLDQGSTDQSVAIAHEFAARHDRVVVIEPAQQATVAYGLRLATGQLPHSEPIIPADAVIVFEQGARAVPGWHAAMVVPFAQDERIAAVGCMPYNEAGQMESPEGLVGTLQTSVRHGESDLDNPIIDSLIDVEFVAGPVLALRTTALNAVGLFKRHSALAACEAIDLCYQLNQAQFQVVINLNARVTINPVQGNGVEQLRAHHREKLASILKTWPFERLIVEFAAAELQFVNAHAGHRHFVAHQQAYGDALLDFDAWLQARQASQPPLTPIQRETLHALLVQLHQRSILQHTQALETNAHLDQLGTLIKKSEQVWNIHQINAAGTGQQVALQGFQRIFGLLSDQQSNLNAVLVHLLYWLMELSQRSIYNQHQIQRASNDLGTQRVRLEHLTSLIQERLNQTIKPLEQRVDEAAATDARIQALITALNERLRTNGEQFTTVLNHLIIENMHEHHDPAAEF